MRTYVVRVTKPRRWRSWVTGVRLQRTIFGEPFSFVWIGGGLRNLELSKLPDVDRKMILEGAGDRSFAGRFACLDGFADVLDDRSRGCEVTVT
jgi:hypothetical protein